MNDPRVLLDTNVLVSAVLFGGVPGRVVEAVRAGDITGLVSLHVLGEFREVLTRPRFGIEPHTADALAEEIAGFCEVVAVECASEVWCDDPHDDPVVEAALVGGAAAVITGDAHLLLLRVRGLRFLTPAAFLTEMDLGR